MRINLATQLAVAILSAFAAFGASAGTSPPLGDYEDRSDAVHGDEVQPTAGISDTETLVVSRMASSNQSAASACQGATQQAEQHLERNGMGVVNTHPTQSAHLVCATNTDFRSSNNGEVKEFGVYVTNMGNTPVSVSCKASQGRGAAWSQDSETRTINPTPNSSTTPQLIYWTAAKFNGVAIKYPIVVECTLPARAGLNRVYAEYQTDIIINEDD